MLARMFSRVIAAGLLGLTLAPVAGAQETTATTLPVGSVVRLAAPTLGRGHVRATLRERRGDTLVVAPLASLGRVAVPMRALTSLEVAVGDGRRAQEATALGAFIGGSVGGFIGTWVMLARATPPVTDSPVPPMRITPVLTGALVGGLLGGTIGWRVRPRRWAPVPLPSSGS